MQEIFWTIVVIWVISRLFSAFSGNRSGSSQTFQQTNNNHFYSQNNSQQKKEGDIKIETKKAPESKIPPTEGEYVDYEEVN